MVFVGLLSGDHDPGRHRGWCRAWIHVLFFCFCRCGELSGVCWSSVWGSRSRQAQRMAQGLDSFLLRLLFLAFENLWSLLVFCLGVTVLLRLQDCAGLRLISSSGFCLWERFRVGLSVCLRCTVLQSLQEGREDGTGLGLISSSGFAFGNVLVFCLGILQTVGKEGGVELR